jgi:hypothetical protein
MSAVLKSFYQYEVPWVLDKSDMSIINRNHGFISKSEIVKKLWDKASKK